MMNYEEWKNYSQKLIANSDSFTNQDGSKASKDKILEILLNNTRQNPPEGFDEIFWSQAIGQISPNLISNELIGNQALSNPHQSNHIIHTLRAMSSSGRLGIQILKETAIATERQIYIGGEYTNPSEFATTYVNDHDQKLLAELRNICDPACDIYDQAMVNTNTPPTFVSDLHVAIFFMIRRALTLIASRTRRGAGNRIVVSPTALTIMQSGSNTSPEFVRKNFHHRNYNVQFVGLMNNINVYIDSHAPDNTPILATYKGTEMDSGVIYTPLLPIKTVNKNFATVEDGLHIIKNTSSTLGNTSDYFASVGINAATLSFV